MNVITFPENPKNTSGLQILLHGVISLPDVTSYDDNNYIHSPLQKYCRGNSHEV